MAFIELVLGLLLAVAVVGAIAKWTSLPLPLLLVAGGVALSFLPGFASARIEPSIFFLLFIPPLLFADGWLIPKRDLLNVLRPVLLLAFGLVTLTVIAVGYLIHWLIPGMPLAVAFALGAIVSPTDAVAVTAITERLKMPSRITHILAGESLINDASGLVAFKFAVAAVATGMFSWVDAAGQVVLLSVGGLLIGVGVALVIGELRVRMTRFCVNDPTIQTTFSLLTPYAAYLAAEALHVSGILSVVAAGIYAGIHDTRHLDTPTRAHSNEVWTMLLFAFNGLVFLLLGVQLRAVLTRLEGETWLHLAGYALALLAALIVVRIVWVFPAAYLPRHFSEGIRTREPPLNPRAVFLVGWAGIRGSVTMAAALSIPFTLDNGAPFPGRDLVIFLAGTTIVLTLVLNAITLPLFIRLFDIRGDGNAEREERAARIATAQAAIDTLQRELPKLTHPKEVAQAQRLMELYERRLNFHSANADRRRDLEAVLAGERRLMLAALEAERVELLSLRDTDVINEETLRMIQADLDHAESLAAPDARRAS
jgi:CPA1 family monovalent cation:H+ antiporter